MKKNRNLFANVNVDRDTACFALALLLCAGIGTTVVWEIDNIFNKPKTKKENIMNVIKAERDTAKVKSVNIMELISTKQK